MPYEAKTVPTEQDPAALIAALPDDRRADAAALLTLLQTATGHAPVVWGRDLIGYGRYQYRYASGHAGESFLAGFSPRKDRFSIYITAGCDAFPDLMARLGKYQTGKSCLYVRRLADVDPAVLSELVARSVAVMRERYPASGHE